MTSANEPKRAPDRDAGVLEFRQVVASFGFLDTLAGSGAAGDDTNDWDPGFEGGPARSADLSTPHNALGDAAGNTFIVDKDAHAVRKVSSDGVITTVAGVNRAGDDGDSPLPARSAHLKQPNGIWLTPGGTLYILDLGNEKVRKLDRSGMLSTLFAVPGLSGGRGLWVASDESCAYVCSGKALLAWTPAHGVNIVCDGFTDLGNLFVDDDGTAMLTDRGTHRVLAWRRGEAPRPIAGSGQPGPYRDGAPALHAALDQVRGVWRHPRGGLLLATHRGSQVFYLDTHGFVHRLIDGAPGAHAGDGEPLTSPGAKISAVRNVTMNPQGDLLVTENDLGFVRVARAAS